MAQLSLEKQIVHLGEHHDLETLQKLVAKTSVKALKAALSAKLGRSDCPTFWNFLLLGFGVNNHELREKRFACVKHFLDALLKVELSYKQTYDLITRLCQDLSTGVFAGEQLVEIYEHCIDGLRLGDPKCVGWKDLLPEIVKVVITIPQINVNGVNMTGIAYREMIMRNLNTMRWPAEVLTPIADMYKELNLSTAELNQILKKFALSLDSLAPTELPALCFQLFSMCNTAAQIVIPLMALEKYFHRYYYKKLFADMNSNSTDFDSIDKFSDHELREAEETILHHLNYCTQYKITELQMCTVLRNLQAIPDVVLTPFMISAIITMSNANRDPDARLTTSMLLPFLRSVIKHNEDERTMSEQSFWCRDTLHRRKVDLVQVFTVLIDQNKEGKDTITPGLVNLAFILLKTRNNRTLNALSITFLTQFIRKRFIFGQGVVKKIAEWMILEQEQYQYSECLMQLSVADTFTVSECIKTIQYVMDFFLWLPGEQAMRMMSFILPILKISAVVRDAFIEILRKALSSSDTKTRRMAIYGFCMILKQLNNSNAQRTQIGSAASSFCTQHSISGFSLMSQATLGNRSNPQRHFNMLTLEIIGALRQCFGQTLEIKLTLYEYLQRAVELNSKLTPHVLQFIDWHFRSYFITADEDDVATSQSSNATEVEFAVKFDKIVQANDLEHHEIVINDNLGQLIHFVAHCLVIFEKHETDYDTRKMKGLLKTAFDKIIAKEFKFEPLTGALTHYKHGICAQEINFIEGIMAYILLTSTQANDNVKYLGQLFREHQKLSENLKKAASSVKKQPKKSKNENETQTTAHDVTINGRVVAKFEFQNIENIWDLLVTEKLLRLLHEDIVPFAAPIHTTGLRSNVEFVRYLFDVTIHKIEAISLAPDYKQLAHSKRTLKYLTDITKVVYERCIKCLPALWHDFDMKTAILAAECFQQCLQTANKVYKKNFQAIFIKGFDVHAATQPNELLTTLHNIIDTYMQEMESSDSEDHTKASERECIPAALLLCLEVLYDNISYNNVMATKSYDWLLKFCTNYTLQSRQLCLALKLLFAQCQKTHLAPFFHLIALQFARVLGRIDDNLVEEQSQGATQPADFKSIHLDSINFCLPHLFAALRKQIEDVEYFIVKANNTLYKYRIEPESDEMSLDALRSLQRSICTKLAHISNVFVELTNVCIPLGVNMDGLLKLLMQHYVCLKNLAKHFLSCAPQISWQGSKFDFLLRAVGKPLSKRIYPLITYIESNILDDNEQLKSFKKKKINPKADKEKVLRETKQIPKLILCMENFSKHVILLSKKTDDRLANFLHYGIVRDFRVRSKELAAAIERTFSHSSQIESVTSSDPSVDVVEDDDEATLLARMEADSAELQSNTNETSDTEEATDEQESNAGGDVGEIADDTEEPSGSIAAVSREASSISANLRRIFGDEVEEEHQPKTPTPEGLMRDVVGDESETNSRSQLMRNLRQVNIRARKRTYEAEQATLPNAVIAAIEQPEMKRRRGRSSAKK